MKTIKRSSTSSTKSHQRTRRPGAGACSRGAAAPGRFAVNILPGISLCMIVRDESQYLGAALASVAAIVNEIIVVDTGSSDDTVAIALSYGATVVRDVWRDDFARARNRSLELATRHWIVVLDADERLRASSCAALAALAKQRPDGRGRWIACRNLTDEIAGSGALTNAIVRIFPNDPAIRYRNRIHEYVARDGEDGSLPAERSTIEFEHHGYLSAVVALRRKADRNLRLAEAAAADEPHEPFHHYNVGMARILGGDLAGAIAALERMNDACRLRPRGFRIHGLVALADCYSQQGDDDHALDLIDTCIGLTPSYSNAHYARGKVLARRGRYHAARDAFGAAIAAGARNADHFVVDGEIAIWKAHNEIGASLMIERRFELASSWFELAADARPDAVPLLVNWAKCREALGDLARARTLYATAFANARDAATARELINFLLRAGVEGDALDTIDLALPVVAPRERTLLLATAAAIHERAGRRGEAIEAVERAVDGTDGDALRALAELVERGVLPHLRALVASTPRTFAARAPYAFAR